MQLIAYVTSLWEFASWNVAEQKYDITHRVGLTLYETERDIRLTDEFDVEVDEKEFEQYELLQEVTLVVKSE